MRKIFSVLLSAALTLAAIPAFFATAEDVSADTSKYPDYTYNIDAAISYADAHVFTRNPAFKDYSNLGGNCANFVSQCLLAGGFPRTDDWEKKYSFTGDYHIPWYYAHEHYLYFKQFGTAEKATASNIRRGDPVYYDWDSNGRIDHVALCVGTNASGQPIIDSNTTNSYHGKWRMGGTSRTTYYVIHLNKESTSAATSPSNDTSGSAAAAASNPVPSANLDPQRTDGNYNMYRLFNPYSGEHFYTAKVAERNHLMQIGWNYEGIGWVAPGTSSSPVYRLFNPFTGDHHYTLAAKERDYLVSVGWNDEGIGWYSDDNRTVPIYRQYNPYARTGAHNFTRNKGESDHLASIGWNYEGIAWYAAA
ncbi:MAG: amidase domain-containing protein [Eubacterium sp.]|nr:amidase domain-containing protein [Eubacterium sp.]